MKRFTHQQVTVGTTIFASFTSAYVDGKWENIVEPLTITFITPSGRINAEGPRGKFVFAATSYSTGKVEPFGKSRGTYSDVFLAENSEDIAAHEAIKVKYEENAKAAKDAKRLENERRAEEHKAREASLKVKAAAANPSPNAINIFNTPFWTLKVTTIEGYERDITFTMTPTEYLDWGAKKAEDRKRKAVEVEGWVAAHSARPRSSFPFSLANPIITDGKSPSQVVFEVVSAIVDRMFTSMI